MGTFRPLTLDADGQPHELVAGDSLELPDPSAPATISYTGIVFNSLTAGAYIQASVSGVRLLQLGSADSGKSATIETSVTVGGGIEGDTYFSLGVNGVGAYTLRGDDSGTLSWSGAEFTVPRVTFTDGGWVEAEDTGKGGVFVRLAYDASNLIELSSGGVSVTAGGSILMSASAGVLNAPVAFTSPDLRGRPNPQVSSAANGSFTPVADAAETRMYARTALSSACTISNPTGTAFDGQTLIIRLRDNGTARALTWGSEFRSMTDALPTTTVINKTMYLWFMRNVAETKWDLIRRANQP